MILMENYLMLVYKWKNWGLRKTQDHSTNHWEIYFFILSLFMCNMFWTIPDPGYHDKKCSYILNTYFALVEEKP